MRLQSERQGGEQGGENELGSPGEETANGEAFASACKPRYSSVDPPLRGSRAVSRRRERKISIPNAGKAAKSVLKKRKIGAFQRLFSCFLAVCRCSEQSLARISMHKVRRNATVSLAHRAVRTSEKQSLLWAEDRWRRGAIRNINTSERSSELRRSYDLLRKCCTSHQLR